MTTTTETSGLPLEGLLVLDFSQFLAGPSCALRLADLGATVVKVERPDGGDLCRSLVVADQRHDGDSALFHTINRNKASVAADLKSPADLARVKALVARADVMIHNFRPGVMTRIGLDAAAAQALNPRLVYAEVSGYGSAGPWRNKPGQDLLVQSLSGLAWLSGDAGGPPVPTGVSVIDIITGAHLVQGILAALLRRGVSGRGAHVEVSLLESALDLQFEPFTAFLNGDGTQPARSAVNHANVHTAAPYGIYRTADGHLALAMAPPDDLARLLDCAPLAVLAADRSRWFSARDSLKAELQRHLLTAATAHWLARLEPAGIWCADVLNWPQLREHPGFEALGMTQTIGGGERPAMLTTRCPIRIDGRRLTSPRPAPRLGADTDSWLPPTA
ncbi:MAG: CaiB/BaiF CoA-transferase family protein [Rubrivivax sp.]